MGGIATFVSALQRDGSYRAAGDGLRFRIPVIDYSIGWQVALGTYEPEVCEAIRGLVQPGSVCLDLGANLGFFSVVMARTGAKRVHAFEPFPETYALLKCNVAENGCSDRVATYPCAADSGTGPARIYFAPGATNGGGMFVPASDNSDIARMHQSVKIKRIRVDDAIPASERVSFIKMDIEGSELRALRGMERILRLDRPVIILEFNTVCLRVMGGIAPSELLDYLRAQGYRIRALSQRNEFTWTGGEALCEPHSYSGVNPSP